MITPAKKAPEQMAFSSSSGSTTRNVARERAPVEQCNASLEHYAGFRSNVHLMNVDLASHEGHVARGLVNLQPCLNSWSMESRATVDLARPETRVL